MEIKRFTECSVRQQQRCVAEVAEKVLEVIGAADIPEFVSAFSKRMLRGHAYGERVLQAAEQQQLQQNVTSMCEDSELKGNHGRGGVIARLGAGLPTKQVAAIAGCSVRTVQRAKKDERENPARDQRFKQTLPLKRIRVPLVEKEATIRWLHEMCPTRSGTV